MLSQTKFNEFKEHLGKAMDRSNFIRLRLKGVQNFLKTKSNYYSDNNFTYLQFGTGNHVEDIEFDINASTFLSYIATFEAIIFEAIQPKIEEVRADIDSNEISFYQELVFHKKAKDFQGFSAIKDVIEKRIGSDNLEYLVLLIDVRNYIAHGRKTKKFLNLKKGEEIKAKLLIINDLKAINKRLIQILELLKKQDS